MEPDEIDLAPEPRSQPLLRRTGRSGSAENVERATGQLAGRGWRRRWGVERSPSGLAAPRACSQMDHQPLVALRQDGSAGDRRHGGTVAPVRQRQIIGGSTLADAVPRLAGVPWQSQTAALRRAGGIRNRRREPYG